MIGLIELLKKDMVEYTLITRDLMGYDSLTEEKSVLYRNHLIMIGWHFDFVTLRVYPKQRGVYVEKGHGVDANPGFNYGFIFLSARLLISSYRLAKVCTVPIIQ